MGRVWVIHWNRAEAKEKAALLRAAGYRVDRSPVIPSTLRRLRENPPEAVVIDLSRLPSHGRDVGLAIRHYKTARGLPIVFVDGDRAKVDPIEKLLPDAIGASCRKRWSLDRLAEEGIRHPYGSLASHCAGDRPCRRVGRLQGVRGRRDLVRPSIFTTQGEIVLQARRGLTGASSPGRPSSNATVIPLAKFYLDSRWRGFKLWGRNPFCIV